MKKVKHTSAFIALYTTLLSCGGSDSSSPTETPTIIGKWAFGPVHPDCNTRNSIEFKNTNVFYEHHYSGNCQLTSYPGDYIKNGDIIFVNDRENVILELTSTRLKLFDKNDDETEIYDRVN